MDSHPHKAPAAATPLTIERFRAILEENPSLKGLSAELWHSQTGTRLQAAISARRLRPNTQEEAPMNDMIDDAIERDAEKLLTYLKAHPEEILYVRTVWIRIFGPDLKPVLLSMDNKHHTGNSEQENPAPATPEPASARTEASK